MDEPVEVELLAEVLLNKLDPRSNSRHPDADPNEDLSRLALVAEFASCQAHRAFEPVFDELRYTAFEKVLAKAILQIEGTARPLEVQVLEFCLALATCVLTILVGSELKNYTVGRFQIGVKTSLAWTRTPVAPREYLRRLVALSTRRGSARVFRIAVRRSGVKDVGEESIRRFAEFFNGRGNWIPQTLRYVEVLSPLVRRHGRSARHTALEESRSQRIDTGIEKRLSRIRDVLTSGTDLDAAVIICSLAAGGVLYEKYYGSSGNRPPVLRAPRLVGSTLKMPLYSAFLEQFHVPVDHVVQDEPMNLGWRGDVISPRNSDRKFRGPVTVAYAFANSINIPAVRIADAIGLSRFVGYLRRCGIHQPLPNTPLLALGPIRLTGVELLATITPVLTGGVLSWPAATGEDDEFPPVLEGERVLSPETCAKMRQLLEATITQGTGQFLAKCAHPGLGGKTGTSEGCRDFWFVGLVDEDRYGLVWLGYRDERAITAGDGKEASASRFAVPLWSDVLSALLG